MGWFKPKEGKKMEQPEIKPRNQILQTPPEKVTQEAKGKLNKPGELSPEEKQKQNIVQLKVADKFKNQDKPNASADTAPKMGQRELER